MAVWQPASWTPGCSIRARGAAKHLTGRPREHKWVTGKKGFIIAGGLTPENVGEAVRTFIPWGVDVVTGVEREPGRKDPEKLKAFVAAVRRAEQR